MARITIEFDTQTDFLEDVIAALQFDAPKPRRDEQDDNAHDDADIDVSVSPADTTTLASILSTGAGATTTATTTPGDIIIDIVTGETWKTAPLGADLVEAAKLGPMDGDRKRGEPRPGGRRRTNAQIADDDRWFAYLETIKARGEAALNAADKSVAAEAEDSGEADGLFGEPEDSGNVAQISTGEERVDPAEAAQDKADEETETAAKGLQPLDALRRAVGRYTTKFGMTNAVTDIPRILGKPVIAHAPEEVPAAIALIEEALAAPVPGPKFTPVDTSAPVEPAETPKPAESPKPTAVEALKPGPRHVVIESTETNPTAASHSGSGYASAPTIIVQKPATVIYYPPTLDGVKAAMMAYGKKYDGTDDQKLMKQTGEDMPKLLQATFGPGVVSPSRIPADAASWGKAVAAVCAAITGNPYGRTAK